MRGNNCIRVVNRRQQHVFSTQTANKRQKTSYFFTLTNPWTLDDMWFSSVFYAFSCPRKMEGNALSLKENFFQSNLLLLENTNKQRIPTVFPSVNRTVKKENIWIMERIIQFADSKITGKLWILLSENVRKFRTCFPNRWTPYVLQWSTHTQNNEIEKYLKIYVEITVLYTTEMLLILQGKRRLIIPKFIIIIHGKRVRRKIIPNSWKKERLFKFQLEMICK